MKITLAQSLLFLTFSLLFLYEVLYSQTWLLLSSMKDSQENKNEDDDCMQYLKMCALLEELPLPISLKELFYNKSFNIISQKSHSFFTKSFRAFMSPLKKYRMISIPNDRYYKNMVPRFCYRVINHQIFESLVFLIMISNLVILLLDEYRDSDPAYTPLSLNPFVYYGYIFAFIVEFLIRNLAERNYEYVQDNFNKFDIVLMLLTIVQACLPDMFRFVTFLRQIRILRVSTFRVVFWAMKDTIQNVYFYFFIQAILNYIFTLISMQLFAGKVDHSYRNNFNNIETASLTVFKIIVGDNWNEIMYKYMKETKAWSAIYFVFLIIICNYIMLNLLLATIISSFISAR